MAKNIDVGKPFNIASHARMTVTQTADLHRAISSTREATRISMPTISSIGYEAGSTIKASIAV